MAITYPTGYPTPIVPIAGGAAPPPPPPLGGRSPRGGGRKRRNAGIIDAAVTGLREALIARGYDPNTALHFANIILSRPGVTLTRNGVRYQGKVYDSAHLATSRLADFVTGELARKQNESVIQGDPGYLAARAQLGLNRDFLSADLGDQQRRAAIDWGDPAYAPDSQVGQAAAANPFSAMRLLERAYRNQALQKTQDSNRAGTLFGGGYQSGQQEAGRVRAANLSEGTRSITDLLAQINQQRAQSGQQYSAGISVALAEAQQRLLQAGQIHAVSPPAFGVRRFHVRNPHAHRPGQQQGFPGLPPRAPHNPYPTRLY